MIAKAPSFPCYALHSCFASILPTLPVHPSIHPSSPSRYPKPGHLPAQHIQAFRKRPLIVSCSSESCAAPAHDIALTHQLGIKLTSIQCEIDVKVNTIESALRRIHPLKVLFEILSGEITGQGDDFLDTRIFGIFWRKSC